MILTHIDVVFQYIFPVPQLLVLPPLMDHGPAGDIPGTPDTAAGDLP
jgi:hypothetical protein